MGMLEKIRVKTFSAYTINQLGKFLTLFHRRAAHGVGQLIIRRNLRPSIDLTAASPIIEYNTGIIQQVWYREKRLLPDHG